MAVTTVSVPYSKVNLIEYYKASNNFLSEISDVISMTTTGRGTIFMRTRPALHEDEANTRCYGGNVGLKDLTFLCISCMHEIG